MTDESKAAKKGLLTTELWMGTLPGAAFFASVVMMPGIHYVPQAAAILGMTALFWKYQSTRESNKKNGGAS